MALDRKKQRKRLKNKEPSKISQKVLFKEVRGGFEPPYTVLQTGA